MLARVKENRARSGNETSVNTVKDEQLEFPNSSLFIHLANIFQTFFSCYFLKEKKMQFQDQKET